MKKEILAGVLMRKCQLILGSTSESNNTTMVPNICGRLSSMANLPMLRLITTQRLSTMLMVFLDINIIQAGFQINAF